MKSITTFILITVLISIATAQEQRSAFADARREYLQYFQTAADEFNVPADVLKGIAFAETRWTHLTWAPGDTASCMGMPRPYGVMSLWDNDFFGHSLRDAARLIGRDVQDLKDDPQQNIRGAAALLRRLYDSIPKPEDFAEGSIERWRNAIAAYSRLPRIDYAQQHALDIYSQMTTGYHKYGIEWDARPVKLEQVRTAVQKIQAEEAAKRASTLKKTDEAMNQPDYPLAKWAQAYTGHWYTGGNPKAFVVEHDMEGYYLSVIVYFQQSSTQASIHYCVNSLSNGSDSHGHIENKPGDAPAGEVTQMVEEKYWAWHVRCWNTWMFGIEHEGFVNDPVWYTEEMYTASAKLTAYLCDKYGIPKDRNHIIGHNEWQNASWKTWMSTHYPSIDATCNDHTDPGQYWNWNHYMALVTSSDTIAPVVVSVTPSEGDTIPAYKNITVSFNTSMDAASTESAFSIVPAVVGTKSWNGNNTVLTFHPSAFLPFGTTFTVTIDTSAKNIAKKLNLGAIPYQFSFTTVATDSVGPMVINSYPAEGELGVSSKADVVITMGEPVLQSSLSGTIKLFDAAHTALPLVNAKNDTVNDHAVISFTSSGLAPNGSYTVVLYPGIKDYYGNATTDTVTIAFSTSPDVVTAGLVIDPFETNSHGWKQPPLSSGSVFIDSTLSTFAIAADKKLNGTYAGKMTYRFTADSGGAAVEQLSGIPSLDSYSTLGVWVAGDQSMNEFKFRFLPDSQVVSAGSISWRGWKYLEVSLTSLSGSGKKIDAFIVQQKHDGEQGGTVFFDDMQLNAVVGDVAENGTGGPEAFALYQNYPNPFNPTTTVEYSIGTSGHVRLTLYSILGAEIATLVDAVEPAGTHAVRVDGSRLGSGVYFYTLRSGGYQRTQKMVLMK